MRDIKKRRQFSNVGELKSLLTEYSDDTDITVCGIVSSFFHEFTDAYGKPYITLDDDPLDELYVKSMEV